MNPAGDQGKLSLPTSFPDEANEIEEQMIFEEYKIWKKNSPFLYDTLYSHALTWPSLSVEWFPNRDVSYGSDCSVQKLLIGTHTSNDEQNYLQIMNVSSSVKLDRSKSHSNLPKTRATTSMRLRTRRG